SSSACSCMGGASTDGLQNILDSIQSHHQLLGYLVDLVRERTTRLLLLLSSDCLSSMLLVDLILALFLDFMGMHAFLNQIPLHIECQTEVRFPSI
ncbi:hypothetical protein PMAYCL1PPCAC_13829, partial [Pristionchus mayeri]